MKIVSLFLSTPNEYRAHVGTRAREIGLNKKVSGYPIMTYYYPIIVDDIPIMPLYNVRTRYSLVRVG
jgi:hypothetical protein